MNYDEEIKRSNHQFWLDIYKILFDKIFLGFLIAICAFIASFQIEKLKGDIVKGRFLLEKRLQALGEIRSSYAKVDQYHSEFIASGIKNRKIILKNYQNSIDEFGNTSNKISFLFTRKFAKSLTHHYLMHISVASESVIFEPNDENWRFAVAITENFEETTRQALHSEALSEEATSIAGIFQFPDISDDEITKMPPKDFFKTVKKKWINEQ